MSRLHFIALTSILGFVAGCPGCPYGPEEAIPLAVPADVHGNSPQYREAFTKEPRREKGPWGKQKRALGVPLVDMLGKKIGFMGCALRPTLGAVTGFPCEDDVDAGALPSAEIKAELDPCRLDDAAMRSTFFKGPSIPPEQIHLVHPYLDDVELAYEGERLRAVTFVANEWIQRKELALLSIPEVTAPMRRKENLCRGSHWCVTLEAFPSFDKEKCTPPPVTTTSPNENSQKTP